MGYGIVLKSFGKDPNKADKDKILQEKQAKLKSLQQKFINKNKELVKDIPKNGMTKITQENVFNKPKVDKDLKQQLNNANKKLEELRNKEVKYKDTIFKLKNNLSNSIQELQKEKENNTVLSNKLSKYLIKNANKETEIENLKYKYNQLEQSYTIKAFNILTRDIYRRDKKIIKLQNNISNLENEVKNNKEYIFDLKHGEEITIKDMQHYKSIITRYAQENIKLNKRIQELEKNYKEKVTNLVNSDIVLGQLKNDIEIAKGIKGRKTNKSKWFGTLKTINSFVFFENLDGQLNPANIDNIEFKENIPCKAVIYYNKNNTALIQKVYNEKDIFIQELKESKHYKRKQERKEFLYENVKYENQYNVLIIGAENKGEYLSTLRRIGLNVVFYNSYEGNVVRLRNMLDRHDIVICCLRHSRHYASNLMIYMQEKDSSNFNKYNLIDKDNLENIIGRVRYCIENM